MKNNINDDWTVNIDIPSYLLIIIVFIMEIQRYLGYYKRMAYQIVYIHIVSNGILFRSPC